MHIHSIVARVARRRVSLILHHNINLNVSSLYQVLLVTSSRRPELWIVPGGGVEPDEESSLTATREVLEEAGVTGELGRCLGIFEVSACYVS